MDKAAVERHLATVTGFDDPSVPLEQYTTPADLAANLIHLAALHRDLADRTVVDLGTGTGMLAIGTAFGDPTRVVGIDRDPAALRIAQANEASIEPPCAIEWLLGDATRAPLCLADATIVMNPPFGAQTTNEHADRRFLETVASIGAVSYSIHNAESQAFVEAFATDNDATVTHAFASTMVIDHQFDFHTHDRREIDVEIYRIDWSGV